MQYVYIRRNERTNIIFNNGMRRGFGVISLAVAFYLQGVDAQCGKSSIQPQLPQSVPRRRIINGNMAVPNSWPWTVHVFYNVGGGQGFMCGGSLINPNGNSEQSDIILTAAHCTMNEDGTQTYAPDGFTVTLGAQDISNSNEATQIRSQVVSVQPHQKYDAGRTLNDVALLKLSSPVQFSQYIQPICLPTSGQVPANPNQCYAVGWGRISNNNGTTADVLQQVLLPVLPDETCGDNSVWGGTYDPSVMTCAGYLSGTKSTCQGDSGGPLVCTDGDHFTLFGSTSFGSGMTGPTGLPQCAVSNSPSVFARTSSYVDWIQQTAGAM